jgi:hypothetical protein
MGGDFAFSLVHIVRHTLLKHSAVWVARLTTSIDIYHLVKLFMIIVLMGYLLWLTNVSGYISWVLVFTTLFIDDAFLIHQRLGSQFNSWFDTHFLTSLQLPPRIFELTVLGVTVAVLSLLILWSYRQSTLTFRKITRDLLFLILALLFFGILVDLASAIGLGTRTTFLLGFIEDSGEMVVYSLLLWVVYRAICYDGEPPTFLRERLFKGI